MRACSLTDRSIAFEDGRTHNVRREATAYWLWLWEAQFARSRHFRRFQRPQQPGFQGPGESPRRAPLMLPPSGFGSQANSSAQQVQFRFPGE